MRVSIVSRIYSPEPSAASYMLAAIADGLSSAGHDVTVVTSRPPRDMKPDDTPSVRVRRAPVLRDRNGYVRGYLPYLSFDLLLAFRLLFSRRPDLYIVEPPPTTGAVVRVVAALQHRPYLYDAADIWSDAASLATSSKTVLRLLRAVELFALRGARQMVTISTGVVERARELGVTSPMTVVGFGADTRVFTYLPGIDPPARPFFVYPGSYSEWHGADIFIEAFATFVQRHATYELLFVGNGSERELLEARARELGIRVTFQDPVPGERLSEILSVATSSLASLKPGVGYDYAFTSKAYSSLAAGCPVLFTGPGPTAPFLREAALSVRSGLAVEYDTAAVVAALTHAAANPLTIDDRRALATWTNEHHSLRSVAARVVRVAESTAGVAK